MKSYVSCTVNIMAADGLVNAKSQGISNNDIDLVILRYSSFISRQVRVDGTHSQTGCISLMILPSQFKFKILNFQFVLIQILIQW